jgi:AraC-like DNA-binding protein
VNKLYIWENRVFYLGELPDMSEHRLGGAALCLGIDKPLQVLESESNGWQTCRSVLIPPGCLHEINTGGAQMAVVFLEPESEHYAILREVMQGGEWQCLYGLAHESEALKIVHDLYHYACDAETTYRLLDDIIDPHKLAPDTSHALDTRIDKVVQLIKEDISQSYSVEELANRVNLSPTRLVHLFKEQTGVPIRRFRQWNRMKAVVAWVAAGGTLTEAALQAGFSDSAHLSRAFRNMFGLKPSFLLNRSADLAIVIGQ